MSVGAEKELANFLAAFTPAIAATAKKARRKIRSILPGASELVYDNYNALAIGYAPGEKASEAIVSLAIYPSWVRLFFLQNGPSIPDPGKRLDGSANRVRSVRMESADTLDEPEIRTLIAHAIRLAVRPIDPMSKSRLLIKSVSAKQRPRRPT